MGLFTSNCPNCNAPISWFLDAPSNYECFECGTAVSKEQIEESWRNNYDSHMLKCISSSQFKDMSVSELSQHFKLTESYIQKLLNMRP